MGRSFYCAITAFFLYGSMTCVYVPAGFHRASLLSVNSAFLASRFDSESPAAQGDRISGDQSAAKRETPSRGIEQDDPENNRESNNKEDTQVDIKGEISKKGLYLTRPDGLRVNIHNIPMPRFVRGLYLSNNTAGSRSSLAQFIAVAKKMNINTFVVDVQKDMIPREHVDMIKKVGIFPVARVVVFPGGLKTKTPAPGYIENIMEIMDAAAHQGFLEVQLDYIRYADSLEMEKLPLDFKYRTINEILQRIQEKANSLSIFLSADLFGRVTLNENDQIGQKLEHFSKYTDTIYPMLYPSHYTNDDYRIAHPYETVKEGVQKSVRRCKNTRIVAYIQGFSWRIETSGKSLSGYIRAQMEAVDDAGGDGWVIWNAKNDYSDSFNAITEYYQKKKKGVSENSRPMKNNREKL